MQTSQSIKAQTDRETTVLKGAMKKEEKKKGFKLEKFSQASDF